MVDSRTVKGPQVKMRIHRWRLNQPTTSPANDDEGGETASKPSSARPNTPLTKRVAVEFINAAHPRDATSAAAVSSIRSHAARGAHASRRVSILPPCTDPTRKDTRVGTGRVSQKAVACPASLGSPRFETLFQGIRPITKLEYFLLDYCR